MKLTRREALTATAAALNASAQTPNMDLCLLPAKALAAAIRKRDISCVEVINAFYKRIERINPTVNAIVTLIPQDKALAAARKADESQLPKGPLHGLPIAHKDLQETKGIRTTYGSKLFENNVPTTSSLTVERIQNAGAITIGKTNTPEWGAGSQTFNTVFGATKNAYDTSKTPGGSSGGAAVSLATHMLPIADGSDFGGSLRNPASWSNVVGFRTCAGRIPRYPTGLGWFSGSVDGPMARTVEDLAFLLSVMAGPDPRSPISLQDPGSIFAAPLEANMKGRRIAWAKDLGGLPFDKDMKAVVDSQRKVFESLGCIVEQAEPDFTGADFAFKTIRAFVSFTAQGERLASGAKFKDTLREEIERGSRLTVADLAKAETTRTALYHRMRVFFETHDYFILPVTQVQPFDVTQEFPTEINGVKMESYIDWMKSCYYISITGLPAISVPAGFTPQNLPCGLQIVGRQWAEFSILQLAHAYQQATDFQSRRPGLSTLALK